MRDMEFHDAYVPAGGEMSYSAVTLGAGKLYKCYHGYHFILCVSRIE